MSIASRFKQRNEVGWGRIIFCVLFSCFGSVFVYVFSLQPLMVWISASSWQETPCAITSSTVDTSRGKSTTYRVNIHYKYSFNGRAYESGRYDGINFSSSGYDGKREIVDQYPAGLKTVCYVDPQHPTEAVLSRSFPTALYWTWFTWLFVIIPMGVLYVTKYPQSRLNLRRIRSTHVKAFSETLGPVALKPKMGPGKKALGILFFALFWNGIVSVFVVTIFRQGGYFSLMGLFLVPFVLVGIGLIVWVVYQFLALFNPRPVLVLSSNAVCLGEKFLAEWKISGRVDRFEKFRVLVEAREEVTYRRGTSTYTDKSVFFSSALVDESSSSGMSRSSTGHAEFAVPLDTMHSLDAPNNKIVWYVRIIGEIPRWPDMDEEFEFKVNPFSS
jgi:hypothetical protein